MEGRKRKTRVALPSRNVGNDQPSTESGQLHLSSRRQRCDDPLNPPSTFRSRLGCGVARLESSRRWDRWATATTMQCVRASSPRSSASCPIASASAPRARRGSRSSTSSRASTILDGDTRLSLADRVRACAGSLSRASPGSGCLLSRTAVSEVTEQLWEEYEAFATRDLSEAGSAERAALSVPDSVLDFRGERLRAWCRGAGGHRDGLYREWQFGRDTPRFRHSRARSWPRPPSRSGRRIRTSGRPSSERTSQKIRDLIQEAGGGRRQAPAVLSREAASRSRVPSAKKT